MAIRENRTTTPSIIVGGPLPAKGSGPPIIVGGPLPIKKDPEPKPSLPTVFVPRSEPKIIESFITPVTKSLPMSLQLNDIIGDFDVVNYGNTGIAGGQGGIDKALTLAKNMDQSAAVGSSAGIAAPAAVVNGEVKVNTQTQGDGLWSDIIGVLGNVAGQIISQVGGGVAAQGGAKVIPVGGGVSVISSPVNPSQASQPGGQVQGVNPLVFVVGGFVALYLILKK